MVAYTRGRTPLRAARLNVELLESRDTPTTGLGAAASGYAEPVQADPLLVGEPPVPPPIERVPLGESGFVITSWYSEGYEYGNGTGMGWANGGSTIEPVPAAAEGGEVSDGGGTAVYVDGSLATTVYGAPALTFLPLTDSAGNSTGETLVFVNGQPFGTVRGEPVVAGVGPAAGSDDQGNPVELGGAAFYITGSADSPDLPDQDNLALTATPWVG